MPQIGFMPNFAVSAKTQMEKIGQMSDRTPLNTRRTIVHVRWAFHEPPSRWLPGFSLDFTRRYEQTPGKGVAYATSVGPKNSFGGWMHEHDNPASMRSL